MSSRGFVIGLVVVAAMLTIGGCVIDGSGWGPQVKYERTVELQHAMQAGSTLTVSTASGSIDTRGQETDQVQAVATIQARAGTEEEARELAEGVVIRFEEAADKLAIKADMPVQQRNRSISISYKITQPRQTGIDGESASGSLRVMDLDGNVAAHTASGSVAAERIKGSTRLTSASGSVRGEQVSNGDVKLESASGGVHLSDATGIGACELHSSSGSATARNVQAESIRMSSASGHVTLDEAQAKTMNLHSSSGGVKAESIVCSRLNAESSSGGVSAAFSRAAPPDVVADMTSGSGSVRVVLPPGFAGWVDLSTTSGSLDTDLPITLKGSISKRRVSGSVGQGSGRLTARAVSGSVRVR